MIQYAKALPFVKLAGWDIAITDAGAVVVEVNDFWDRTGQFFIRRGWRNEVRDCFLAWKSVKPSKKYNMGRLSNKISKHKIDRIIKYQ